MYFSVSGLSLEAVGVWRVLVVAAGHRPIWFNFVRFEEGGVAGLSLKRSSSDWRVGLLESRVGSPFFHLFWGKLANICSTALELGRVRNVFFCWRCVKPLRFCLVWQVVLFVLALPFKPCFGWLINTLLRHWPFLLHLIRLVVGLIAALDDLRVVMRLQDLLLLPFPPLRGHFIRSVKLTVRGPGLKLKALFRTAMLA